VTSGILVASDALAQIVNTARLVVQFRPLARAATLIRCAKRYVTRTPVWSVWEIFHFRCARCRTRERRADLDGELRSRRATRTLPRTGAPRSRCRLLRWRRSHYTFQRDRVGQSCREPTGKLFGGIKAHAEIARIKMKGAPRSRQLSPIN
jgi:hypothetical protein